MNIHQDWWVKKHPTLYLLDFAILLAIFQQYNVNEQISLPSRDFLHENVAQTLEMQLLPGPFVMPEMIKDYKIKALLKDLNNTDRSYEVIPSSTKVNVTAHMVLVSPLEVEEEISIEHGRFSEPVLNTDQDFIHAGDAYRLNNINQSTNSNQTDTNIFDENGDVRWRQYLNTADDCEAASSHCETNNTNDDDLYSLSNLSKDEIFSIGIFNDLNSDHNKFLGCSSSLKVSSDLSLLYRDRFNHSCKNQGTSDSAASSSKTLSYNPGLNSLDSEVVNKFLNVSMCFRTAI